MKWKVDGSGSVFFSLYISSIDFLTLFYNPLLSTLHRNFSFISFVLGFEVCNWHIECITYIIKYAPFVNADNRMKLV